MNNLRLGILISGRGSNLQAIIKVCNVQDFPAKVVCVISNRTDAQGLQIAREANIPHFIDTNEREITTILQDHAVELVCMAGFMKVMSSEFVNTWYNRLLNIHPSLLPAFKGLNAIQQALDANVKIIGCTIHYVRTEIDSGPIILQGAISVTPRKTVEKRLLCLEHKCYPLAIKLLAEKKLVIENEIVSNRDNDTLNIEGICY